MSYVCVLGVILGQLRPSYHASNLPITVDGDPKVLIRRMALSGHLADVPVLHDKSYSYLPMVEVSAPGGIVLTFFYKDRQLRRPDGEFVSQHSVYLDPYGRVLDFTVPPSTRVALRLSQYESYLMELNQDNLCCGYGYNTYPFYVCHYGDLGERLRVVDPRCEHLIMEDQLLLLLNLSA